LFFWNGDSTVKNALSVFLCLCCIAAAQASDLLSFTQGKEISSIAFSADSQSFIVASDNGNLTQYSVPSFSQTISKNFPKSIQSVDQFGTNTCLSLGSQQVLLLDANLGVQQTIPDASLCALLRDNQVVYTVGKSVLVASADSVKRRFVVGDVPDRLKASKDRKFFGLSDGSKSVFVYPADGSGKAMTLTGSFPVRDFAFSDSTLVVGDLGGRVTVWDLRNGKQLFTKIMSDSVVSVSSNARGGLVAVATFDRVVSLLELQTQSVLQSVTYKVGLNDLEFSPNDRYLALAFADGTLRIWGSHTDPAAFRGRILWR
jgi:WD40 repeat protein